MTPSEANALMATLTGLVGAGVGRRGLPQIRYTSGALLMGHWRDTWTHIREETRKRAQHISD